LNAAADPHNARDEIPCMSSSAHSDDAPKLRLSLRADSRIANPYPTVLRRSDMKEIGHAPMRSHYDAR